MIPYTSINTVIDLLLHKPPNDFDPTMNESMSDVLIPDMATPRTKYSLKKVP